MTDGNPETLGQTYRGLTDKELLSLDQAFESLTPKAKQAIAEEFSRRGLSQTRKDEFLSAQKVSQIRDEQVRKRAALVRRRRIEGWFTSTSIIIIGWTVGGLAWFAARLVLAVPPEGAKKLAIIIGVAATLGSGLVGVVILHRRQRWRKLKSQNRQQ